MNDKSFNRRPRPDLRSWGALPVLLLAMAGGCSGASKSGSADPELGIGQTPAADDTERGLEMTLPRLGGGKVSLSELRGKPVVLALFTTWSLRCQAEAPLFIRMHERYHTKGLRVVGVALDMQVVLVKTYVDVVGLPFDVLLASPDDLELVGALGQTRQIPRTVLLDRSGQIVLDQRGQTDFSVLERRIRAHLTSTKRGKL